MSPILERRKVVVDQLVAAGVRVVDSPVPVAPCAQLWMPSMAPGGNVGASLMVTWHLSLFAQATSLDTAWEQLERMREEVWRLFGPMIVRCDPGSRKSRKTEYQMYEIEWAELVASNC